MHIPRRLAAIWLSLTTLLACCAAQDVPNVSNTTDPDKCPGVFRPYSPNAPINSTGYQPFQWSPDGEEWYFTVTFNDTRNSSMGNAMHIFQSYISAPIKTSSSACVYALPGIDAEESDGLGCDDALSAECRDWLMSELTRETNVTRNLQCPGLPDRELIMRNCGDSVANGILRDSGPSIELANTTCAISSPPGTTMPSDYLTHPALGFATVPERSDRSPDSFTYYDQYVRQLRPWIIAASHASENGFALEARLLCIAPGRVVQNSKKPGGKWRPNSGSGTGKLEVNTLGIIVGSLVGTMAALV